MKQLFLKTTLLLFISILFSNCDKNDINNDQLSDVLQNKTEFTLKNFKDPFVKENLIINWGDYNIKTNDSITLYEYNTSFKTVSSIEQGNQQLYFKYNCWLLKKIQIHGLIN